MNLAAERERILATPLEQLDPSDPDHFANDTAPLVFERLRREDPVHLTRGPRGEFWSVTRWQDIMAVDTNHQVYSSDWSNGGISLFTRSDKPALQMFIAMDPPKHDEQRKAVSPIVAPGNLARMEGLIRERTIRVLETLPRGGKRFWGFHHK